MAQDKTKKSLANILLLFLMLLKWITEHAIILKKIFDKQASIFWKKKKKNINVPLPWISWIKQNIPDKVMHKIIIVAISSLPWLLILLLLDLDHINAWLVKSKWSLGTRLALWALLGQYLYMYIQVSYSN